MTTSAAPVITSPPAGHLFLAGVSWSAYRAQGEHLGERPLRLTYDHGRLEIMVLSCEHEGLKKILARLLEIVAEETGIELFSGGSMTFQSEDLDRGLEPDECYWIQHEAQVRGRTQLDLATDPPPD